MYNYVFIIYFNSNYNIKYSFIQNYEAAYKLLSYKNSKKGLYNFCFKKKLKNKEILFFIFQVKIQNKKKVKA